ncbi:MAG: TIGR00159 family protein [Candidatus Omnitrophica bacterium CG11_big_fil_rev_8_21_14_0_20_45_26]|uniref:Diadenylate cyclase n=1 Tax=Candidatus Abzuiibacterium crystallinum TaxID=1974748 RepID=A0A2H0LKM2_9BACT|nr:MAG: TIGR00159 family protein [Candidatus Omnitrophica bacterium CG11_big_fil_rev_8_21_14_0_20_45_26]PIW63953.1 MAG: TIGR00159 family protein [Candidatus Omnitrophica bacterium CG12_big_fil_rev_8_21_14_0_65_45_16]
MEFLLNISWKPIFEICVIWCLIYYLIRFLQGTHALQVLIGMMVFAVLFNVAKWFGLNTLEFVLGKLLQVGVLAFIILFQPELRRVFARVGQNALFSPFLKKGGTVDEIIEACIRMAKINRGALIAIEREVGLQNYFESGVPLDAKVSAELLISIFSPSTPIHDGAVVVQGNRIAACGVLFPLSQSTMLSRTLGTRHRAAIGFTEETDAVCIVVSEETGKISVSVYGKLTRDLDEEGLKRVLKSLFRPDENRNKLLEFLQNKIRLVPKPERSKGDL